MRGPDTMCAIAGASVRVLALWRVGPHVSCGQRVSRHCAEGGRDELGILLRQRLEHRIVVPHDEIAHLANVALGLRGQAHQLAPLVGRIDGLGYANVPINSEHDLDGLRIRVLGHEVELAAEALGISPVGILQARDHGNTVVDASHGDIEAMRAAVAPILAAQLEELDASGLPATAVFEAMQAAIARNIEGK